MPVATRKSELVRRDLNTCPGGYVVLRQLSYDEMLERRDGGLRIMMEKAGRADIDPHVAIQLANKWSNYFTFPRAIVEHNLTDENGVALDFSRPELVFKHLDPKVGAEIERYIDELNQEEEPEGFMKLPGSSWQEESDKQDNTSEMNS